MRRDGRAGREAVTGTRRVGRVAAAAAGAAVLLAGCGVPTSGVVDVGVPASGLPAEPPPGTRVVLYFVDGGRLRPVGGLVKVGRDPVAMAIELLLAGPAAAGRPDLTTHVRMPAPPAAVSSWTRGRTVTVRLPAGFGRPDPLGSRQLACTAASAAGAARSLASRAQPSAGQPSALATPVPLPASVQVVLLAPGWHDSQVPNCPPAAPGAPPASGG